MRSKKILKSVFKSGLTPFQEGRRNFRNPKEEIEKEAQKRIEICKVCPNFQDETIEEFKVNDKLIHDASNKYCDDCGCIISYKIRQNKEICERWINE